MENRNAHKRKNLPIRNIDCRNAVQLLLAEYAVVIFVKLPDIAEKTDIREVRLVNRHTIRRFQSSFFGCLFLQNRFHGFFRGGFHRLDLGSGFFRRSLRDGLLLRSLRNRLLRRGFRDGFLFRSLHGLGPRSFYSGLDHRFRDRLRDGLLCFLRHGRDWAEGQCHDQGQEHGQGTLEHN